MRQGRGHAPYPASVTLPAACSASVLACRHVDEVIIGSPWEITRDLLVTMDVSVVVTGTHSDSRCVVPPPSLRLPVAPPRSTRCVGRVMGVSEEEIDKRFGVAKEMGIFKQFEVGAPAESDRRPRAHGRPRPQSPRKLSSQDIMIRVMENKSQFEEKFNRKNKSEQSYLASKTYVKEK